MLKHMQLITFLTLMAVALYGCVSAPPRSDQFIPVKTNSELPNGYDSYTILLFPDYRIKGFYNKTEIETINESFKFFGKAIGKKNLAAYFLNADNKTHSVERAMGIIDNINKQSRREIDFSSAPIIIYTNFNPEKEKPENGFVTAVAFRGADPNTINGVVTRLTQLIRESKVQGYTLEYEEISLQIEKFAKKIKLELKLGDMLVLRYE